MIPTELTQFAQWVNWRYENDSLGKPTKVPYHAPSGRLARVDNPNTWCDYITVCAAMTTGFYAGIGFVLSESDPYTFIDLDDPFKDVSVDEGNIIAARHNKVLTMMDSYAEWSPSGKGMHIIVKGRVPDGRRRAKMEIYSTKRYMTVTGSTCIDKPIADRMDILPALYAEMGTNKVDIQAVESTETQTDYAIWETASKARNGDKFVQLWNGQWEGIEPSHSEADFALINMLSFYSRNKQQIERMFLASGLGARIVSGQKKKAKSYIPKMIERSFDNQLPEIDFSQLREQVAAATPLRKTKPKELPAAPPLKWEMPPGLLGEITEFIYSASPLPVAEVALAGAIAMMAGIVGRAYNVSEEGLNVYLLVLALTGTGKEAAAKGIGKLFDHVEVNVPAAAEFRGPAEIASGPALTKHLAEKAPACFSLLGEFGMRLHQMCSDNAHTTQVGLRRVLLDLYHKSGKGGSLRPHVYSDRDKNTATISSPAYTILGESTPGTFYRHLDESMVSDGLLPRFTIIEYTGDRVDINRTFMNAKPSEQLVTKISELCTYCLQMHSAKRVLDVQFDESALGMYWDLSAEYTRKINQNRDDDIARQLLNRAHIKIMKIAAIIAVGVNPIRPTITVPLILWAKAMIDRDIVNIMHKFSTGRVGRETSDMNQVNELTTIIAKYIKRDYDETMRKYLVMPTMKAANVIPYQYILRLCASRNSFRSDKSGSTFAIRRAIEVLISEGALREIKGHVLEKEFGSTMKAYAIVDVGMFEVDV